MKHATCNISFATVTGTRGNVVSTPPFFFATCGCGLLTEYFLQLQYVLRRRGFDAESSAEEIRDSLE
jgi:hypothetical protein